MLMECVQPSELSTTAAATANSHSSVVMATAVNMEGHNEKHISGKAYSVPEDAHREKHDMVELNGLSKLLPDSSPKLCPFSTRTASPISLLASSASSPISVINAELESDSRSNSHSQAQVNSSQMVIAASEQQPATDMDSPPSKNSNNFIAAVSTPNTLPNGRAANHSFSPPLAPASSATASGSIPSPLASSSPSPSSHSSSKTNLVMRSKLKDRLKHSQSEQRRRSRLRERFDQLAQLLIQTKGAVMPADVDGSVLSVDEKSMMNERRDRFTVLNSAIERLQAFNRKVSSMQREIERLKRMVHSPNVATIDNSTSARLLKEEQIILEEELEEETDILCTASTKQTACADSGSSLCLGNDCEQISSMIITALKRNPHATCALLRGTPFILVDSLKQQILESNAAWKEVHSTSTGISDRCSSSASSSHPSCSSPFPAVSNDVYSPFNNATVFNAISSVNSKTPLHIIPARITPSNQPKPELNANDTKNDMEEKHSGVEEYGMIVSMKQKLDSNSHNVLAVFLPPPLLNSAPSSPSSKRLRPRTELNENRIGTRVKNEDDESKPPTKKAKKMLGSGTTGAIKENGAHISAYSLPVMATAPIQAAPTLPTPIGAGTPMARPTAYVGADGLIYEAPALYGTAHEAAMGMPLAAGGYLANHYGPATATAAGLPPFGFVTSGRYLGTPAAYDVPLWHHTNSNNGAYPAAAPYYSHTLVRPAVDSTPIRYYSESPYSASVSSSLTYQPNVVVDPAATSRYSALSSSTIRPNKISAASSSSSSSCSSPSTSALSSASASASASGCAVFTSGASVHSPGLNRSPFN